MKVRDLIAESVFTPGPGRTSTRPPRVTVILPTFRRGDSGLLARAIDSLLDQTFTDFEILIVDDASIDSTGDVIADAMRRDPRVSVVRHAHNIGLPAVSEYEGFTLARGGLIAFAFDDTVFYPDALGRLVEESDREPGALVVGYVTAFLRSPVDDAIRSAPLGRGAQESDLLADNVIPNSAVLAPRDLLDEVGLYDPHVSLARLCDYDLWLRVRRRRRIRFVDVCVGEEHGPATTDSLGSTYILDRWLSDDRMRQDRDEMLRPENFNEIDVFADSAFSSSRSRAAVAELASEHVRTRPHLTAPAAPRDVGAEPPRVLVIANPIDASVQRVFEGLRDVPDIHVRIAHLGALPLSELGGADVLVVARHLVAARDWLRAARAAGIPIYCYLDDNLPLMSANGELEILPAADFGIVTLRSSVAPLAGVLASSDALAESFREQELHAAIFALQLVAPRTSAGRPRETRGDRPTFAIFVGPHRMRTLERLLLPALRTAARRSRTPLRVLVPEPFAAAIATTRDNVEIVPFTPSADYFVTLRDLRAVGVDALVVPDARTVNTPFTTEHALLSAASIESGLVAAATGPYADLDGVSGVTLVDDPRSEDRWSDAFARVIADIADGGSSSAVDPALLSTRFAAADGAQRLLAALGSPATPDPTRRLQHLAGWLAYELSRERSTPRGPGSESPESAATDSASAEATATIAAEPASGDDVSGDTMTPARAAVSSKTKAEPPRLARTGIVRTGTMPTVNVRTGNVRTGNVRTGPSLASVPYVAYPLSLAPGHYSFAVATVLADADPGDVFGLEVVDPSGHIVLHTATSLPRSDEPVDLVLDARRLEIDSHGRHELRVFALTTRPAYLLEAIGRRPFRRATADWRPLVTFSTPVIAPGRARRG